MRNLEEKIKSENQIKSPPIQDVMIGKIDPKTKKPYVIEFGQKGESVRKVQDMLDSLEYGLTLKGYNPKKAGVDGDFGNNTFDAVTLFQWKNELKETGIVDSETLKLLTSKSNEKKQENEK
jgi:peptidoglycan hydrolase-like protein with peptidoglycan-binding domain